MRVEKFYCNEKTYLIFITRGSVQLDANKTHVQIANSELFNWNFKCINDGSFDFSDDDFKTSDEALIGAMSEIMSNH